MGRSPNEPKCAREAVLSTGDFQSQFGSAALRMNANPYEPRNPSQASAKRHSPQWMVWITVFWLVAMATILTGFFVSVIASFNDNKAVAKLTLRIIVILLITGFLLNIVLYSTLLWRGWWNRPNFPTFAKDEMLFDEKSAGGYSMLSWHTRKFPRKNGIRVSIARDQLWIRPRLFPFVSIGLELDMVHEIPLVAVEEVIVDDNEFDVTYSSSIGTSRSVRLWLRKPEEFVASIRSACPHARVIARA